MKRQQWIGLLGAVATLVCGSAFADETVNIGGSRAVLMRQMIGGALDEILAPPPVHIGQ